MTVFLLAIIASCLLFGAPLVLAVFRLGLAIAVPAAAFLVCLFLLIVAAVVAAG